MKPPDRHGPVPVTLCADDYALSPGVDDGILALAEQGRITALSCISAAPRWPAAAVRLRPLFGRVDIGLHFTLTQLAPLGPMKRLAPHGRFPDVGALFARAMLRMTDLDEIAVELSRQIGAFVDATGREPDFLDGHHHVHELPGVREVVARAWQARARTGWIRNTATSPARVAARGIAIPRAGVLAALGYAARRTWRAAGFPTNADFAGVRNFGERRPFRMLMQRYLAAAAPGLLIMCHPGRLDAELARVDAITTPRAEELAYLLGGEFPIDLAAAGCRLDRLSSAAAR